MINTFAWARSGVTALLAMSFFSVTAIAGAGERCGNQGYRTRIDQQPYTRGDYGYTADVAAMVTTVQSIRTNGMRTGPIGMTRIDIATTRTTEASMTNREEFDRRKIGCNYRW
jgi:hypothetical protein